MIGIGNDESKRINNDDKDENDSIEKEGYKYNEDKCNNKDNDDDDSDNDDSDNDDDDWKIECIDVIVRLVSITPGHVKLDWLPPPKVDRVNESDKDDNNNKNEDE